VIGDPPSKTGASHLSEILVAVVTAALFDSTGGSGLVLITAPLPATDAAELPYAFVANTVT
jgi:hypothetical protein